MVQADYQTALEQLEAGHWAEALQSLNQVLRQDSQFADAYYQRGRVRSKLRDFQGAIDDYTEAVRLQPTAEAFLQRAIAQLSLGRHQAAVADASQATRFKPNLAIAHRLLGKACTQVGDSAQAIAAYKQAAQCYLAQQDKANAQYCITQIEQIQARSRQPSASQSPSYLSVGVSLPQDFLQQAVVKTNQGKYSDALLDLNWFLKFDPNHAEALCQRGAIHAKLGNSQAAIQDLARAIQMEPDNRSLRLQRGVVCLSLGDAHGAIADFTELIQQDGSNAHVLLHRGHGYRQLGDLDKAFKDYSNAIGIRPEDAELYRARAEVQQEMGELDGALSDYQQAASFWFNQGNWSAHRQLLTQIENLRARLKQQAEAKAAAESRIIRVPIKYRSGGTPVVEAIFNDRFTFDMVFDTGASITLVTARMARVLQIVPVGRCWCRMANGQMVELDIGWIQSLAVQTAVVHNLQVAIADREVEGLLGQNFFFHYDVRMLANEIEFHRR